MKVPGLPLKVIMEAEEKAWEGKAEILSIMKKCLSQHKQAKKSNHPVTQDLQVPVAKRSRFVGLGGYNLRKLMAETGM